MENVDEDLKRTNKTRMTLIQEQAVSECVTDCEGNWFMSALEVFTNNQVDPGSFALLPTSAEQDPSPLFSDGHPPLGVIQCPSKTLAA